MKYEFVHAGKPIAVEIERRGDSLIVHNGDNTHEFTFTESGLGRLVLRNSKGQLSIQSAREKDRVWVWMNGRTHEFQVHSGDSDFGDTSSGGDDGARAPMPGTLIKLMVNTGDKVEQGQVLAVIEAMKMEHQIRAPRGGVVEKIAGTVGTIIDAGALVVSLAAEA